MTSNNVGDKIVKGSPKLKCCSSGLSVTGFG